MTIVIIKWPEDPDRGEEVYGPFMNTESADIWVKECQEAAELGRDLLGGAYYVITKMEQPFEPTDLMKDGVRCRP